MLEFLKKKQKPALTVSQHVSVYKSEFGTSQAHSDDSQLTRQEDGIVATAGLHGDDGKPVEPKLMRVYSVADLPEYKTILTGKDGKFELAVEKQEVCVAIGLESKAVWILVTAEFYANSRIFVMGLRERMRKAELITEKVVFAEEELIAAIYDSASRLRVSAAFEEVMTEEGIVFDQIVRYGLEHRASDIHIEVRGQQGLVRYRINGDLEQMHNENRGIYVMEQLRDTVGYAYNKLQSERTGSHSNFNPEAYQSCMIPYKVGNAKMNLRYQSTRAWGGFDVVLRYLHQYENTDTKEFCQLGYSEDQARMLDIASRTRTGLVMVAGVTGSGKSTTLKTIIENIPDREHLKIFTIEDPVEYAIPSVTQVSLQRTFSADSEKMPYREIQAVLMRCDPDTVMVGEIRDLESGETAQTLIETGHQVMATVHANSIFGVFPRLLAPNIGFSVNTLTAPQFWSLIIYQALVPVLCKFCRIPAEEVIAEKLKLIRTRFLISTDGMYVKNPSGCESCNGRGTTGVSVVAEMMQPTRMELRYIRENSEFEAEKLWRNRSDKQFDTPRMEGKTVFEHALYKAYLGEIDPRVVERFETFERFEII